MITIYFLSSFQLNHDLFLLPLHIITGVTLTYIASLTAPFDIDLLSWLTHIRTHQLSSLLYTDPKEYPIQYRFQSFQPRHYNAPTMVQIVPMPSLCSIDAISH